MARRGVRRVRAPGWRAHCAGAGHSPGSCIRARRRRRISRRPSSGPSSCTTSALSACWQPAAKARTASSTPCARTSLASTRSLRYARPTRTWEWARLGAGAAAEAGRVRGPGRGPGLGQGQGRIWVGALEGGRGTGIDAGHSFCRRPGKRASCVRSRLTLSSCAFDGTGAEPRQHWHDVQAALPSLLPVGVPQLGDQLVQDRRCRVRRAAVGLPREGDRLHLLHPEQGRGAHAQKSPDLLPKTTH